MTDQTDNHPAPGRSFWFSMAALAVVLLAVCIPLYLAANSFLRGWFSRDRGDDPNYAPPPYAAGSATGSSGIAVPPPMPDAGSD